MKDITIELIIINTVGADRAAKKILKFNSNRRVRYYLKPIFIKLRPNSNKVKIKAKAYMTSISFFDASGSHDSSDSRDVRSSSDIKELNSVSNSSDSMTQPQQDAETQVVSKPIASIPRTIGKAIPFLNKKSTGKKMGVTGFKMRRMAANEDLMGENKEEEIEKIKAQKISETTETLKTLEVPETPEMSEYINFILRSPYTAIVLNKKKRRRIVRLRFKDCDPGVNRKSNRSNRSKKRYHQYLEYLGGNTNTNANGNTNANTNTIEIITDLDFTVL